MKWDTPTVLLLLTVLGVGAFVMFKGPTQSEKNAELLKQVAKLVAAIALLKKRLGLSDKSLKDLMEEMKRLHPGTSTPTLFAPMAAAAAVKEAAENDDAGGEGMWAKYTSDPDWDSPYP
ncbi:hypothetical protein LCGC14_0784420 [marine sediment metagenome]|uniref:Uncharacterized protein n=1 Tax=marine sediment metagenome TaxID=412755 RepID=A0A0F9T1M7_9ZZZZ|nr:hypothetical protein [Phycisphaerae bacterium]